MQTLNLIYDDIEVLTNGKNFIQLPNEVFLFIRKVSDANIMSMERITLAFDILTYKHDEKNPYPSHELLAKKFEVSKRAITQAVSDIVNCGLFINEKGKYAGLDKRKNTYNVKPLLNLLGRFVEEVRAGRKVDIKKLFTDVVGGKTKAKTNDITLPKEEKKPEVFSDRIEERLSGVSESRQKALRVIIKKNLKRLDDESIVAQIDNVEAKCKDESKFYAFAVTCFRNANNGNTYETHKKAPSLNANGASEYSIAESVKADREEHKAYEELSKELQTKYLDVADYFEQETGMKLSTTNKEILNIEAALKEWVEFKKAEHGSYESVVAKSKAVFMDMLKGC